MKIIFYGASPEIKEITQSLGDHESLFIDETDQVKMSIGKDEAVLVLNADFNLNEAKALNQRYSSNDCVKTILISNNLDLENENLPVNVGLYGEFNAEKLKSAILDNAVSENETIEKDIQDAFNMGFGEEEESAPVEEPKEESAAEELELLAEVDTGVALEEDSGLELTPEEDSAEVEVEAEPAPTESGSGSYSIVDEESDLTFNLGQDLDAPEETPAKAPEEKVEEVKAEVELGGEEVQEEKVAEKALGDLELGEDLSEELVIGDDEPVSEAPAVEEIGDLDLDLGEDLTTQAEATPEPAPEVEPEAEVPMEFTVEIPKVEEEIVSSTKTEVAAEPEKVEAAVVEEVKEEKPAVQEKVEERVVYQYDDNALVRLEATIRQLREEREEFFKQINELKLEKNTMSSENLGFKAEVIELRVEVGLLKKRNNEEREENKIYKQILQDSLSFSEQKIKNLKGDVERMAQRSHIDIGQIRQRERDLEGQLELLTMDSENQINNREKKIQELKRKADALEFNMENVGNREARIREEKLKVEEKLNKIMKSMRSSIKFLEEELEIEPEFLQEIKKEAA